MRILYFHQHFRLPEHGGGIRSYELAKRWVAAGHDVVLITGDNLGDYDEPTITEIDGITVHWLPVPYHQTMSTAARLRSFASFLFQATRRARSVRDVDVVLATSTPLTIAIPGAISARRFRVPFVFEVRDLWPEVPIAMGALPLAPMRWAAIALERLAYRAADHVVALSPGMKAGVIAGGMNDADVTVIPNSSDRALFDIDPAIGRAFRHEHDWLGDKPLLVYTGTFGAANDAGWLVELASHLAESDPNVQLLLVGFGSEHDAIVGRARELGLLDTNVRVWSYLSKFEIARVLSAADIAFSVFADLPELEHNSANKAFDAFASRTPLAINHGGWLADILSDTGAGLALGRDPRSAADEVLQFLAHPTRRAAASQASAALAAGPFDRDAHAARYLEILRAAVDTNP